MLQVAILIVLIVVAVGILRLQYSGLLVATPYAHLLYFLFVIYIGGFLVAPFYGLHHTISIALTGFVTALAALIGHFIVTSDIRRGRDAVYRFSDRRLLMPLENPALLVSVIGLILVTIALSAYFYSGFPPAVRGAIEVVSGRASLNALVEVSDSRFALTKGAYFGGEYRGQGLVRQILVVNAALVCVYAAALLALKPRPSTVTGAAAAVIFAWIVVGGVGDRAPFLETLIVMVSAYSLCSPVKPRTVIGLIALFVVLVLATSLYSTKSLALLRMGYGNGFADLFWTSIERIFVGNSINDAQVIELVDSGRWDYRYGAVHLRNFITAIPGINYGRPVAYELFAYFNPYSKGTTFSSGTYATSAFLDFGRIGASFLFLLCGMLTGFTERLIFFKRRITGLQFLFLPVLSFGVAQVIVGGPTGVIAQLIVMSVVYGFMLLLFTAATNRRDDAPAALVWT